MLTANGDYHFYRLCRALSDKHWQKVRASLKAVEVDADAIMFPVAADPDATMPSAKLKEISLRETLPLFAYVCCTRADFPKTTPKQMAAELTRIIKSCDTLFTQCNALLTRLDPEKPPNYCASANGRDPLWDLVLPMRDRSETVAAKLKRWRDVLSVINTKGNHVSTAHNLFWQVLAHIFDTHVDRDVKSRNQHKIRFLRACSEPFFPEVITDDDKTISAFVERRSTRSTSST